MERKHRLSSLLSIVIIVIVLALIGKNMKVTAFIEDTFISGCLRLMSPAMLFYDKPQLLDNNIWAQLVNNVVPVNAVINNPEVMEEIEQQVRNKCGIGVDAEQTESEES